MVTIARQALGISVEVPQQISIGDTIYKLPPATSTLVPNPNVVQGAANPGIMVELGKRLLEAAEKGDIDEIKELIGRGAPMTADWLGTSPLHKAAFQGHYQAAKILLSSGCSRDARTKVEKTALHLAATGGHNQVIDLLLQSNAEVNCVDMLRMTPLHWAVESGDAESVELLLKFGADVNVENKFDKSPLEIASDKHYTEIYEILLNAESYRINRNMNLESEIATRTITTEYDAQNNQYELTETITVPPEATHTEIVEASSGGNEDKSMKILNNFGITMLPEEDERTTLLPSAGSYSLTEAGKRLLSDTSPVKTILTTPKMQTVQIKQENSAAPKIIRINGSANSIVSSPAGAGTPGQPRLIRLSSSQLNNLKLATGGFKGQKVVIVSSGTNKITPSNPLVASAASSAIKIVQVGKQNKTIAIMPNASKPASISTSTSTTSSGSKVKVSESESVHSRRDLKRTIEELEAEIRKDKLALEQKLAKIERMKSQFLQDDGEEDVDMDDTEAND